MNEAWIELQEGEAIEIWDQFQGDFQVANKHRLPLDGITLGDSSQGWKRFVRSRPARSDGPYQYGVSFGRKVQGQFSGFSQRPRRTGFISM